MQDSTLRPATIPGRALSDARLSTYDIVILAHLSTFPTDRANVFIPRFETIAAQRGGHQIYRVRQSFGKLILCGYVAERGDGYTLLLDPPLPDQYNRLPGVSL